MDLEKTLEYYSNVNKTHKTKLLRYELQSIVLLYSSSFPLGTVKTVRIINYFVLVYKDRKWFS